MLIKPTPDMRESDVTPRELYLRRREFIAAAGVTAAAVTAGVLAPSEARAQNPAAQKLANLKKSPFSTDEKLNAYRDVTTYNNYYEFGTDKADPGRNAHSLKPRPWTITVEGECAKPGTYDIEDILKWFPLEERIYRMRCVEAWSMVIPWNGFPLGDFVKRMEPTSKAKYIEFRTLVDPKQMPGLSDGMLQWPYRRGPPPGRGDASARPARRGPLRRSAAESERRADSSGHPVEVRLQGHQVHRPGAVRGQGAAQHVAADAVAVSTASTPT